MISWKVYDKRDIGCIRFDEYALAYNGNPIYTCSGPGIYSYTMVGDNGPIGIIGITLMWKGVAEVWSLLSAEAKMHPFALHRQVKKCIKIYQKELELHRIQAMSLANHKEGCRWLESLGFSLEATLMNYGHDKRPHCLYSRLY